MAYLRFEAEFYWPKAGFPKPIHLSCSVHIRDVFCYLATHKFSVWTTEQQDLAVPQKTLDESLQVCPANPPDINSWICSNWDFQEHNPIG